MRKKAVFLDRDGTIIRDVGYLGNPGKIEFLDGAIEALYSLHQKGYLLVIITNQSGIARGYFDEETCSLINRHLEEELLANNIPIAGIYYCPHLPGAAVPKYDRICDCRKPGKKLFQMAAMELDIDFKTSWAIGDTLRDLIPAKELGAQTILVLTGKGKKQSQDNDLKSIVDIIAENLSETVKFI